MRNLERIESYLNSEMSSEDLQTFETELSQDRLLQRELQVVRDIDTALSDNEVLDLRNALRSVMKSEKEAVSRRRIHRYVRPALAAAASVVILLGTALIFLNRGSDADRIFQDMYETYPSLYNTRSADVTTNDVVRAMEPYDIGDYATADANLSALIELDPSRMDLVFYRGICQMEIENYSQAVVFFGEVIESDLVLMHEQSLWYRSLSYLAMGKEEEAVAGLNELIRIGSSFSERSRRVINKLR